MPMILEVEPAEVLDTAVPLWESVGTSYLFSYSKRYWARGMCVILLYTRKINETAWETQSNFYMEPTF